MATTRGRGQIISKGKDRWLVRIFLGEKSNGTREYFSKSIEGNKTKAQKYLTGKLREKDLGIFVESSRQQLGDHLDEWLKIVKPRISQQTFESYESLLKNHIRPHIGKMKLSDVKQHHVQGVYDRLQIDGLSPRTVKYVHTVLKMSFKKAIEQDKILRNPCEFAVLPKHTKGETKAMSPEQSKLFINAARGNKHGLIFEFALVTGMRPEEYLALKWSDIDLLDGIARVRRALIWNRKGGGYRLEEPKTQSSRRSVPLPNTLTAKLKTHRTLQLERRLSLGPAYSNLDLVFATDTGTPLNARNLAQRYLTKVLVAAALDDDFVLYSLRHTCATLLLAAGENPKVVAERLGHTSVKMTLDTYSHVLPDMQRSASDRLSNMLYA